MKLCANQGCENWAVKNGRYCSHECREAHYSKVAAERYVKKNPVPLDVVVCGNRDCRRMFPQGCWRKTYCCKQCRKTEQKYLNREKRAALKIERERLAAEYVARKKSESEAWTTKRSRQHGAGDGVAYLTGSITGKITLERRMDLIAWADAHGDYREEYHCNFTQWAQAHGSEVAAYLGGKNGR